MFRRGFKTACEQAALKLRRRLDLEPTSAITPIAIAQLMAIPILSPENLSDLSPDVSQRLQNVHSSVWSAITVSDGRRHLIVVNPTHTPGRFNSNLAHEIAHIMLGHEPSNMFMTAQPEIALRSHNREQEDEANWLAGCILLPRGALLKARRLNHSEDEICAEYGVSLPMLRFRINATGVDAHMKRAKAYRG
jgi:Zn-dependent peptidase ImmA (M78 family)